MPYQGGKIDVILLPKKIELLDYISNFDLLPKPSRKNIQKYIESFYEDIADGVVSMI